MVNLAIGTWFDGRGDQYVWNPTIDNSWVLIGTRGITYCVPPKMGQIDHMFRTILGGMTVHSNTCFGLLRKNNIQSGCDNPVMIFSHWVIVFFFYYWWKHCNLVQNHYDSDLSVAIPSGKNSFDLLWKNNIQNRYDNSVTVFVIDENMVTPWNNGVTHLFSSNPHL